MIEQWSLLSSFTACSFLLFNRNVSKQ